MPTYVYKFIDSGETFEVHQEFTDDALTEAVHPSSGATLPVKKVFTPVGVTFKGGGFYKTDSRTGKSSSTSSTPAEGASASKENGSSSNGSDSGASTSGSDSATPAPASTPSSGTGAGSAAKTPAATPSAPKAPSSSS